MFLLKPKYTTFTTVSSLRVIYLITEGIWFCQADYAIGISKMAISNHLFDIQAPGEDLQEDLLYKPDHAFPNPNDVGQFSCCS